MLVLIIYHANCNDGITAMALIRKFYEGHDIVKMAISNQQTDIMKDETRYFDRIYVVDLSIRIAREILLSKFQTCIIPHNLIWIDHHEADPAEIERIRVIGATVVYTKTESASMQTFRHLFPEKNPYEYLMVMAINKIDLGQALTSPYKEYYHMHMPRGKFAEKIISERIDDTITNYRTPGQCSQIVDNIYREIAYLIPFARSQMKIDGIIYPIWRIPLTSIPSELNQILIKRVQRYYAERDPIDMLVVVNGDSVSLRAVNPDINCAEIAAKMGGGGHRGAAGFRSNASIFM